MSEATENILECMYCGEEKCTCECTYGCDQGYFYGEELPGFDFINDDADEVYPCPSCRGTGLKRNMTLW